jgi:cytochrome P450
MADVMPGRPPVEDWTTDFDHHDRGFVDDPYRIYDDLRDRCPVAHTERYGGMTVLTRYEDVADAAHDTEHFSSRRVMPSDVPTERTGQVLSPINYDPPDHTDRRRLLLPFFSPTAIARWEQPIRDICADLLDRLDGRTECDAAADYAQEIPGTLTARMLAVPDEDTPMFRAWMHDLLEAGPVDPELARTTSNAMLDYMRDLVAAGAPGGDDVVSFLLAQERDGAPLPESEMIRTLFLLLVAGIDTTWSAIGSSMLHLASHPDDRRRLVEEPGLVPTAVEEFLRAYSPVSVGRVANPGAEVAHCPVEAGEWLLMAFPSANRDHEAFERADEVVIDRAVNRHVAFGVGVHRCLGSNLARLEMNIALQMWLERFPEFELIHPEEVWYSPGILRGPRRIPVRLG